MISFTWFLLPLFHQSKLLSSSNFFPSATEVTNLMRTLPPTNHLTFASLHFSFLLISKAFQIAPQSFILLLCQSMLIIQIYIWLYLTKLFANHFPFPTYIVCLLEHLLCHKALNLYLLCTICIYCLSI